MLSIEKTLGPKLQNQTVMLLEMTELFCCFYMQHTCKNQHHRQILPQHISDSILGITFGMVTPI